MEIVITDHALLEARRRYVDLDFALSIIQNPQQTVPSRRGRAVLQAKYRDTINNKEMLLRVIVELAGDTLTVISLYKTSKIDKYWTEENTQ